MKEKLCEIAFVLSIIIGVCAFLYPYFSLANLKNIAEELEKIRKAIEDKKATE